MSFTNFAHDISTLLRGLVEEEKRIKISEKNCLAIIPEDNFVFSIDEDNWINYATHNEGIKIAITDNQLAKEKNYFIIANCCKIKEWMEIFKKEPHDIYRVTLPIYEHYWINNRSRMFVVQVLYDNDSMVEDVAYFSSAEKAEIFLCNAEEMLSMEEDSTTAGDIVEYRIMEIPLDEIITHSTGDFHSKAKKIKSFERWYDDEDSDGDPIYKIKEIK